MSKKRNKLTFRKWRGDVGNVELTFAEKVHLVLVEVNDILIAKNRKYGNSALEPKRIFSRASPIEQIKVRLDDKLSRLAAQEDDEDEDVLMDLLGYLVLLRIAQSRNN
jgi:hypothetical protein